MQNKSGRDTHPVLHHAVEAAQVVHEGTDGVATVPAGQQRAEHEADCVDILETRTTTSRTLRLSLTAEHLFREASAGSHS